MPNYKVIESMKKPPEQAIFSGTPGTLQSSLLSILGSDFVSSVPISGLKCYFLNSTLSAGRLLVLV